MKHQFRTNPRRLLTLAAVIVLLAVSLTACFGNKKPEETINNLPSGTGASEPSKPADTVPPTTIPEPETVWGTVNTDKLNVRTEPSTDSPAQPNKLAIGTRVEILETRVVGDVTWGRIENGWVKMNYITLDGEGPSKPTDPVQPTEPEPTTPPATEPQNPGTTTSGTKGTVTAEELNIRKGAGSSYDKVGAYTRHSC